MVLQQFAFVVNETTVALVVSMNPVRHRVATVYKHSDLFQLPFRLLNLNGIYRKTSKKLFTLQFKACLKSIKILPEAVQVLDEKGQTVQSVHV